MKYTITNDNLHLIDSHLIGKDKFDRELAKIQAVHPSSLVWKRSYTSLRKEWATHNALYAMHILRSRTKDVDLNYPQPWYIRAAYTVVGTIVWPFIA